MLSFLFTLEPNERSFGRMRFRYAICKYRDVICSMQFAFIYRLFHFILFVGNANSWRQAMTLEAFRSLSSACRLPFRYALTHLECVSSPGLVHVDDLLTNCSWAWWIESAVTRAEFYLLILTIGRDCFRSPFSLFPSHSAPPEIPRSPPASAERRKTNAFDANESVRSNQCPEKGTETNYRRHSWAPADRMCSSFSYFS